MRRSSICRLAAAVILGSGLVACSDQPTAPAARPTPAVTILGVTDYETTQVVDFTVDARGGMFQMGQHWVNFPSRSICDPAQSTYGITEWDKPCTLLKGSIRIRAEIQKSTSTGLPAIRFSPDLRFAPSSNSDRWVYLYLFTDEAAQATTDSAQKALLDKYKILWSPTTDIPGIDESLVDSTLVTGVMPSGGLLYRRIKHFSAYQVGAGLSGYQVGSGGTEY